MMHLKIFLVMLIGSLMVNEIDGCRCRTAKHPQDQFCSANYVIKGKIIDSTTLEAPLEYSPETIVYTVRVEVVYKGAQHVSARRTVQISTENSLCGVRWLQRNQKYVIMGTVANGKLELFLCSSYAEGYSSISHRQRQGLKYHWEQECGICTPHNCRDRPCSSRDTCYYEPGEQDCELQFARCTRDSNGECHWSGKDDYEECKIQHPGRILDLRDERF